MSDSFANKVASIDSQLNILLQKGNIYRNKKVPVKVDLVIKHIVDLKHFELRHSSSIGDKQSFFQATLKK